MFFWLRSYYVFFYFFFFSSRRRHTRSLRDWSSDVCSSDLRDYLAPAGSLPQEPTMLPERRGHALEPAQVWEKPAEIETSVYGAYRIDQRSEERRVGKECRSGWSAEH